MTMGECLLRAREFFLSGKFRLGELFLVPDCLVESAAGDSQLAGDALAVLDAVSPGGVFSIWADGGRFDDEAGGFIYEYNRRPTDIAAVIGLAVIRAERSQPA